MKLTKMRLYKITEIATITYMADRMIKAAQKGKFTIRFKIPKKASPLLLGNIISKLNIRGYYVTISNSKITVSWDSK